MFRHAIHEFVEEYEWIHIGVGVLGNATFFVGSVLFLPAFEAQRVVGVWLFIVGSLLMFIGALGSGTTKLLRKRYGQPQPGAAVNTARRPLRD